MTYEDFRNDPNMRQELHTALQIGAVQQAIALVKSKNETNALPLGATAVDCARAHSEQTTRNIFAAELFLLATTMPERPAARGAETFGTKHTVDEFDQQEET